MEHQSSEYKEKTDTNTVKLMENIKTKKQENCSEYTF